MTPMSEGGDAPTQTDQAAMADDLIRAVMTDQKREISRGILPELEPVDPEDTYQAQTASRPAAKPKRRVKTGSLGGYVHSVKARILGYRPTRKHILWTCFALVVFFRPWLIPGLLFVSFWVALIAYLTLGHDRLFEFLAGGWNRLVKTKPHWAEKLRGIASRSALKYNAFRSKLPEKWAARLALPDLSHAAQTQEKLDDLPDPFDRLKMPDVYRG